MPDAFAITLDRIDDQLAEARADQWRAETTLTAIQRQREDLDGQELAAVSTIAACRERYDYLLDERLRAGVMQRQGEEVLAG